MTQDISILRRSAAKILSAAAVELFPGTQLLGCEVTYFGFYCDFIFPFAFRRDFLVQLTEKMRGIQKEGRIIELIEMVPKNASALLNHAGQPELARQAKESQQGLLTLARMGEFLDLSPQPCLASTADVKSFKLIDVREGEGRVRIFGVAEADKQALKKHRNIPEKTHLEWGSEQGLFTLIDGGVVWGSDGISVCDQLKRVWRELHVNEKFDLIEGFASPWQTLQAYHQLRPQRHRFAFWGMDQYPEERRSEGLLTPKIFSTDMSVQFCEKKELASTCFSSLQLIIKILKILDFEFEIVLASVSSKNQGAPLLEAVRELAAPFREERTAEGPPRLEVLVPDGMGRMWKVSSLEIALPKREQQKTFGVVHSVFVKLERVVALLLEKDEGRLPFWLASEQVRLLIVDEGALFFGEQIANDLAQKKVRVCTSRVQKSDLNLKVHEGLKKQVPYIVVVGDREKETETVTVRTNGASKPKTVPKTEFFKVIQEERH